MSQDLLQWILDLDAKQLQPVKRREALRSISLSDEQTAYLFAQLGGSQTRAVLRCLVDFGILKRQSPYVSAYLSAHPQTMEMLFHSEDAKVRKLAYELSGRLPQPAFEELLICSLSQESTYFAVPSLLLALGNYAPSQKVHQAIASYTAPYDMPFKHRQLVQEAQKKALGNWEVETPLTLAPLSPDQKLFLSCPNTKITADELHKRRLVGKKSPVPGFVLCQGFSNYSEVFSLRTFYQAHLLLHVFDADRIPLEDYFASPAFAEKLHQLVAGTGISYRLELQDFDQAVNHKKQVAELCRIVDRHCGLSNRPAHYQLTLTALICQKKAYILALPSFQDHRFSYKKYNISASIKPAAAASVVYACQPYMRPHAKVLDPFCGSGTMLFERSQYPYDRLDGSDISSHAIEQARNNEKLAPLRGSFYLKDALKRPQMRYDEVLTNLPFGLRVLNHQKIQQLYDDFLTHLPNILEPEGMAFLYTHEKRLMGQLIHGHSALQLVKTEDFLAGGLVPRLFILKCVR